jgi:tetratricopeptide (TPR) repeat protein
MVSRKCPAGPDEGKERSFEELWHNAVFELYNITNAKDFLQLCEEAAENKLSKREFVNGIIECESRAADKTRAFYIHVFMPWAKEHHVPTHPASWFLAWRSDLKENLLLGRFAEKTPYWRHYEREYDLIVLYSLTRKGENHRAIELAEEMRKQAETPQELANICRYSGYCLLRLNRPLPAIDAYNEVIRFDPKYAYAYLVRARAYMMLHDTDRAMADYAEAIRLKPSNPEAYRLRGKAYKSMGDEERVNSDFAMATQLTVLWGQGQQEVEIERKSCQEPFLRAIKGGKTGKAWEDAWETWGQSLNSD